MATAQSRLAGWSKSGRNGSGRNCKAVTAIIPTAAGATASSSTAASRKWYTRCLPGCVTGNHKSDITTDSDDDDDDHHGAWTQQMPTTITQIDDFLAAGSSSSSGRQSMVVVGQYQPLSESSSNSKFRPKVSSTITGPIPECLEELPFEARPTTSLSKWFGEGGKENKETQMAKNKDSAAASAASEISLCSTLAGSVVVNEWEKPLLLQQQQSSRIETPDDFDRFRVTELDSRPVQSSSTAAANAPEREAVVVDSTPIPVENHRFVAYPGRETKGQYEKQPQSAQIVGGSGSKSEEAPVPRYSWPLVDFDQELFLNSNPAQVVGRRQRHQEPRIPSLEFEEDEGHRGLGLGLEGQVAAALLEKNEQTQTRQRGRGRRDAVGGVGQVGPGAFVDGSPISPLNEDDAGGIKGHGVYEMEASASASASSSKSTVGGGRSHAATTTTSDQIRPLPLQAPMQNAGQSMSPVSPMDDDKTVVPGGANGRVPVVKYHEYNWPRFSDVHDYQDPADEYSRRYRDRRRELRKRENGNGTASGNGKERVPVKQSRIPRLQGHR